MVVKYKLGELAKDLGLSNKEVITALGDKYGADKKHTSVLSEDELNFAFDVLTRQHNVSSLQSFFAGTGKKQTEQSAKGSAPEAAKKPQQAAPAAKNGGEKVSKAERKADKPIEIKERVSKVVDTRAAMTNVDKYSEKYENMSQAARGSAGNGRHGGQQGKKQKFNQRSQQRGKPSAKRETEAQKLQRLQLEKARHAQLKITIPDEISVGELASRLKMTAPKVIKKLMQLGEMKSVSDVIDFDTAAVVSEELGAKVEREVHVTIEERLNINVESDNDAAEDLVERPPVVVVMGHVDHGKTSLLDYIRSAHVASGEAGGITQHIGAYRVEVGGRFITFLDTPGHEAFTAMRARGASITDIAVLVVAADDGIMPQTVEAINHAKAAGVSIIVAINKMDRPDANPDRVMQGLTEYELVPEEWGGDVICVPVSAKTGQGIDDLLENIGLVADVLELKANPNRAARGAVIEAKLDKGRGPVASLLVQNGTLHTGDVIIAGTAVGRVRAMTDDRGNEITEAGPSVPVEITGLADVPLAGDTFNAVADERLARELVERRRTEEKEEQFKSYRKVTLDNLFSQIEEGEVKELPIIVKADVRGSAEAIKESLERLSNDEVHVRVIHAAVGGVNSSDVMLAEASGAIIIGFNVRPDSAAIEQANAAEVDMHMYRVIYDAIDEVKSAMKGMLAPKIREVDQGRAEVREVYKISSVGTVAGCYVQSGTISRSSLVRIVRDGIIIYDDEVASLRRFKDDVKEVQQGFECGVTLKKFADVKEGDIFETYVKEEYRE